MIYNNFWKQISYWKLNSLNSLKTISSTIIRKNNRKRKKRSYFESMSYDWQNYVYFVNLKRHNDAFFYAFICIKLYRKDFCKMEYKKFRSINLYWVFMHIDILVKTFQSADFLFWQTNYQCLFNISIYIWAFKYLYFPCLFDVNFIFVNVL